jgi:hypothetical protein
MPVLTIPRLALTRHRIGESPLRNRAPLPNSACEVKRDRYPSRANETQIGLNMTERPSTRWRAEGASIVYSTDPPRHEDDTMTVVVRGRPYNLTDTIPSSTSN